MLEETPFLVVRTTPAPAFRCECCLKQLNGNDLQAEAQLLHKDLRMQVLHLKSTSTSMRRCSAAGACNALYCGDACRKKHSAFHSLLCPASSCYETREFVKRSLQSQPNFFAAAALYLQVINSPTLCSLNEAMRWIKEMYPLVQVHPVWSDRRRDDDDESDAIELLCLFISSLSQGVTDFDATVHLKQEDWIYLYNVIISYAHALSVSNPIVDFFTQHCGRLSSENRTFLKKQPEIIHLHHLQQGLCMRGTNCSEELTEREFCALTHAACSRMAPFDGSHFSLLVIPQARETIITLPVSCMPSASIDLVVSEEKGPCLVVQKRQIESSALTLARSINISSRKSSNDIRASFLLSTEVCSSIEINSVEFSAKLRQETKGFLSAYSIHNCLCILCHFARNFRLHLKSTPPSQDTLSGLTFADFIQVGGYFLSQDSCGQKSMAALILHAGYTEICRQPELNHDTREMGNYLHSFATLLLDIVTLMEPNRPRFIPPTPTVVRNHWRSACKMWLHCHKICPDHEMTKNQINKLFAYGSNYDFMTTGLIPMKKKCLVPISVPFERISTVREIDIFRTSVPIIELSECNWIIDEAEKHASKFKWTSNRHYSVPTTDIPLHEIPSVLKWFQESFQHNLRKQLHEQFCLEFDGDVNSFYINDLFIVKYDATLGCVKDIDNVNTNAKDNTRTIDNINSWHWASKKIEIQDTRKTSHQRFLPLHYDQSTHSVVISLNSSTEFTAGGTYFDDLKETVSLNQGCMLSFCGNKLLHGGEPITSGTRYIMTIFLFMGAKQEYVNEMRNDVCLRISSDVHSDKNEIGRQKEEKKRKKESIGVPSMVGIEVDAMGISNNHSTCNSSSSSKRGMEGLLKKKKDYEHSTDPFSFNFF